MKSVVVCAKVTDLMLPPTCFRRAGKIAQASYFALGFTRRRGLRRLTSERSGQAFCLRTQMIASCPQPAHKNLQHFGAGGRQRNLALWKRARSETVTVSKGKRQTPHLRR